MARSLVRIGSLLVLWQIASCEKTETAEVEANQSGQYNGEKDKKISQAEITQVGALDAAELNEDEKDEVEDAKKYAVEVTSHGDLGDEETEELTGSDEERICCGMEVQDSEHDKFYRYECMERRFCQPKKQLAGVVKATEERARQRNCGGQDWIVTPGQGGSGQDCLDQTVLDKQKARRSKWKYYPANHVLVCCGIRGFHVWRSGPMCLAYGKCKSRDTYPGGDKFKHVPENNVVQVDGSKCKDEEHVDGWACESR